MIRSAIIVLGSARIDSTSNYSAARELEPHEIAQQRLMWYHMSLLCSACVTCYFALIKNNVNAQRNNF